jgi:hypothetical protein
MVVPRQTRLPGKRGHLELPAQLARPYLLDALNYVAPAAA